MNPLALFDYNVLKKDDRVFVQQRADKIKVITSEAIVEIGKRLKEVQLQLANYHHGTFLEWVKSEFAWSRSTAYNYIAAYDRFGSLPNFGKLSITKSATYLLAASKTPQSAREEAIERAEAGERITDEEAKAIVAKYQPQADCESKWSESKKELKEEEKNLMAEQGAFPRSPTEIELEKEAISSWEAVSLVGIADKGIALFVAWHLLQEKKILCPDSPTWIIKHGDGRVDSVKDKIQWLKANSAEARIEWLRGSIARAKAMKTKFENMALDSAKAEQVSQIAQGFAEIFVNLSPRLQTKFFRDAIKRYHPDKFPADLDEQELEDRLEIGRVLLEAKKFFL